MIKIERGIFLHIPKTGGTWLSEYLEESKMVRKKTLLSHGNGTQIEDQKQNDVVFCFVRHPLTWLRSYWQCKQDVVKDRRGGSIDSIVDLPFNEFIDLVIRDLPGYVTSFFNGFTNYCHFVGKQEQMRDDACNLFDMMRIRYNKQLLFNKPRSNVLKSEQKYTIEQAIKIMELEKIMVERYNYNYIPLDVIL